MFHATASMISIVGQLLVEPEIVWRTPIAFHTTMMRGSFSTGLIFLRFD